METFDLQQRRRLYLVPGYGMIKRVWRSFNHMEKADTFACDL